MRTFFLISAVAAVLTMALTSCSGPAAAGQDKELVYEGNMLEPQIGEQPIAVAAADTLKANTAVSQADSK